MEIEILHAFSPLLVVAWDQSGSLPQTPEWYQATLTGPLVSVGGCRALSESVYPPYSTAEILGSLSQAIRGYIPIVSMLGNTESVQELERTILSLTRAQVRNDWPLLA